MGWDVRIKSCTFHLSFCLSTIGQGWGFFEVALFSNRIHGSMCAGEKGDIIVLIGNQVINEVWRVTFVYSQMIVVDLF